MKIEAKDSLDIHELLFEHVHSNSWLTIPRDKPTLEKADLAVFDTYKNALSSVEGSLDREVILLFPLLVAIGSEMSITQGKNAGKLLPTELNLDLKSIIDSARMEAEAERKVEVMLGQAAPYGFGKELLFDLRFELQFKAPAFTVSPVEKLGDQKITYNLGFRNDLAGDPAFTGYTATLREPLPPITGSFGVVNVGMLDKRMAKVDWENELLDNKKRPEDPFIHESKEVPGILKSLELLEKHSLQAMEMAGLLKFKYWEGTPNESLIPRLKAYQYEFNKHVTVKRDEHPLFTKTMAANLLSGRPVGIVTSGDDTIWYQLKDNRFRVFQETGGVIKNTLAKMPLNFANDHELITVLDKLRKGQQVEIPFTRGEKVLPAMLQVDLPHGIRASLKGSDVAVVSPLLGAVQDLHKEKLDKAFNATFSSEKGVTGQPSKSQKR